MNSNKIKDFLFSVGEPIYRFNQIENAIYKDFTTDFKKIKNLPISLREKLSDNFRIISFDAINILTSTKGDSHKAVLKLKDGRLIETAALSRGMLKWSICVSTQAGCPVRCAFCYSGRKGLKRNLSAEEIADQVLFWGAWLKEKSLGEISSIVYMGMGEPFLNYENTVESVKIINNKIGIGKRHISVSTCGHVPNIRQFARDLPQVNLAISLHSAIDEIRDKLVPLNVKYPLDQLSKAIRDYIDCSKRKIFIEYIMLDNVNDRSRDARKLLEWIKMTHQKKYFTVNLIPYNETGKNFKPSPMEKIEKFHKHMTLAGVETTIRKSLGSDIKGACGQLALGN